MNIKVRKRDGKVEKYEPQKIGKVVIASGLDSEQAEKLVKIINSWVKRFEGKTISSLKIRDKIIVEMPKISEYAGKQYIWWENYKDKHFNDK